MVRYFLIRELKMEGIVGRSSTCQCPDTFISIPHSFCSTLKKVFLHLVRSNSYLCTWSQTLSTFSRKDLTSSVFPSFFFSVILLLVPSSWAVYNLHLCYRLFQTQTYIPYAQLKLTFISCLLNYNLLSSYFVPGNVKKK